MQIMNQHVKEFDENTFKADKAVLTRIFFIIMKQLPVMVAVLNVEGERLHN